MTPGVIYGSRVRELRHAEALWCTRAFTASAQHESNPAPQRFQLCSISASPLYKSQPFSAAGKLESAHSVWCVLRLHAGKLQRWCQTETEREKAELRPKKENSAIWRASNIKIKTLSFQLFKKRKNPRTRTFPCATVSSYGRKTNAERSRTLMSITSFTAQFHH